MQLDKDIIITMGKSKKIRVSVSLPDELFLFVENQALKRNITKSQVVQEALESFILSECNYTCKIHPKYKAIRKPTSKKKNCVCKLIWKFWQNNEKTS